MRWNNSEQQLLLCVNTKSTDPAVLAWEAFNADEERQTVWCKPHCQHMSRMLAPCPAWSGTCMTPRSWCLQHGNHA